MEGKRFTATQETFNNCEGNTGYKKRYNTYSPGKNTGVGCHFLLQGTFQTQGLNPGLLHCKQTLYQLSHQRRPFYNVKSGQLLNFAFYKTIG